MKCSINKKRNIPLPDAIRAIITKELPLVASLANASRIIMDYFPNTDWCGFYLTDKSKENLYLGPFQGSTATMIIPFGKGVCGTAAIQKSSQLVPNVHEFEGHIACSALSNSEIVVPILKNEEVVGVIDLDSNLYDNYKVEDILILESVARILSELF